MNCHYFLLFCEDCTILYFVTAFIDTSPIFWWYFLSAISPSLPSFFLSPFPFVLIFYRPLAMLSVCFSLRKMSFPGPVTLVNMHAMAPQGHAPTGLVFIYLMTQGLACTPLMSVCGAVRRCLLCYRAKRFPANKASLCDSLVCSASSASQN